MPTTSTCPACNSQFEPSRDWHKYCSQKCKTKAWELAHPRKKQSKSPPRPRRISAYKKLIAERNQLLTDIKTIITGPELDKIKIILKWQSIYDTEKQIFAGAGMDSLGQCKVKPEPPA